MSRCFRVAVVWAIHLLCLQANNLLPAAKAQPRRYICDEPFDELKDQISGWIAAAERCEAGKPCENNAHVSQYKHADTLCESSRTEKRRSSARKQLKPMLPAMEASLTAVEQLLEPMRGDINKLDQEFDRQMRATWEQLDRAQRELFHSAVGAGRIEKGLFYQAIGMNSSGGLSAHFAPSNVEELLLYAWNLVSPEQREVWYGAIGDLVQSANDPLRETVYSIDLVNSNLPELQNKEQPYGESLKRLRDEIASGNFNTLLSLARRYPQRYAYLRQHGFAELLRGEKKSPSPSTLLAVADFPRQLPTAAERLLTLTAITEQFLGDGATVTADAGYVYPLAKLAHEIDSLGGIARAADGLKTLNSSNLADMFNTPVGGKSAEYFLRSVPAVKV